MRLARATSVVTVALLAGASLAAAHPAAPSGPGHTFTTRAGATLWFEVRGTGEGRPLIVVNGGPGFDHTYVLCSDAWDVLAQHRRVVFYDQRGNGHAGALRPGESCTVADQIADLDALCERLGAPQVDLLGHSWGGYLVMAYAARHPQRVAHLAILDSAAPKWTETEDLFKFAFPEATERRSRLDFADALGDTGADGQGLREYLQLLFVSPVKRDEFMARANTYRYSRRVNEVLNADLAKIDMWPMLPTLAMPALVMTGRYDMNVAPSTAWRIHRAIPGSRWHAFENSGHIPYLEQPEEFVSVVEDFLGPPTR